MAGKSSAVADVAAQAGAEPGRSVSHTLAAPAEPVGDLFAFDQELDQFAGQAIAPPRRSAGRPAGSVNRSTLQLKKLLMSRGYRDPAEFLASIVSMDVRELARSLFEPEDGKLTVAMIDAAARHQSTAARELMPYWHQKMPIAIDHGGQVARPLIIMRDGEAPGARARVVEGSAMSIHDAEEVEQDQGLSRGEPEASHVDGSHDGANDE